LEFFARPALLTKSKGRDEQKIPMSEGRLAGAAERLSEGPT